MKIVIRQDETLPPGRTDSWVATGDGLPRRGIGRRWGEALESLIRANLDAFGIDEIVTDEAVTGNDGAPARKVYTWRAESPAPRTIAVPLAEVLDVARSAETYGYADDVLLTALADWCGRSVSDEEIARYADGLLTDEARARGYDEEDREAAVERLTDWRDRYCRPAETPTP